MKTRTCLLVAVILVQLACGNNGPTGPTGNNVVDVAGIWNYTDTLANISGDSCGIFTPNGFESGTLSITQSGDVLNATARDGASGLSCTYTGTAGRASIAMSGTYCDAASYTGIRCANGSLVDITLQAASINATINGKRATGTDGQTWNMYVSGRSTSLGIITLTGNIVATR